MVIEAIRPQLEALAEFWLAAGASSFTLMSGSEAVFSRGHPGGVVLTTTIALPRGTAELRVSADVPAWAPARLRADAAALENALQLDDALEAMTHDLVENQDQLLALYDMARSTRLSFNLPEMLAYVAGEAARLIHAEGAFVVIERGNDIDTIALTPDAPLDSANVKALCERMRANGRSEWMIGPDDRSLPARARLVYVRRFEIRSDASAAIGLINKPNGLFSTPDLKLLGAIADRTGAYLENVLLYEENLAQARTQIEMALARDAQRNLLPLELPRIPGLDIAAFAESARAVGGDFYDMILAPDGRLAFCVGDVSGKGMPAAMMMAVTRTAIRTHAKFMSEPTPAQVLGRVTDDLYDDLTNAATFTTVFAGLYRAGADQLTYANAGHSPVVFLPAEGPARLLEADAPPLGVLEENLCLDHVLPMRPCDVLVVASDGLNEARNEAGDLFGIPALIAAVEGCAGAVSAQDILSRVMGAVRAFSGRAEQADDQTLLVLRRVPA